MVVRFQCVARSKDVSVDSIPASAVRGTGGEDIEKEYNSGHAPILRNGIDKSGQCKVIVDDGKSHTQSLATLLALRSPLGEGDYTVYIDGTACSWHAIVQVSMDGAMAQFVTLKWLGTISG